MAMSWERKKVWLAKQRKAEKKILKERKKKGYSVHSNVLCAWGNEHLGEEALLLALVVHGGLVSLDFDNGITWGDRITNFLAPLANISTGHGRREGRHADLHMRWIVWRRRRKTKWRLKIQLFAERRCKGGRDQHRNAWTSACWRQCWIPWGHWICMVRRVQTQKTKWKEKKRKRNKESSLRCCPCEDLSLPHQSNSSTCTLHDVTYTISHHVGHLAGFHTDSVSFSKSNNTTVFPKDHGKGKQADTRILGSKQRDESKWEGSFPFSVIMMIAIIGRRYWTGKSGTNKMIEIMEILSFKWLKIKLYSITLKI